MKSLYVLLEFFLFHNLRIFDKGKNLLQIGGQRKHFVTTQHWIYQHKVIMTWNSHAEK